MEIGVNNEKRLKKNAKMVDFIWFFIFVVIPFLSLIYSFGEFLYKNGIGM